MMHTLCMKSAKWNVLKAAGATYKPAQMNMPVKTPFCDVVVRRRHSRGSGCVIHWQPCSIFLDGTYEDDDDKVQYTIDSTCYNQDIIAIQAVTRSQSEPVMGDGCTSFGMSQASLIKSQRAYHWNTDASNEPV